MDNNEKQWTGYARMHLLGGKVKSVRYMTKTERDEMGWYKRPLVIELDNGTILFASSDDEGNEGGSLFGQDKNRKDLTFPVL